jgi:hypothetical protein
MISETLCRDIKSMPEVTTLRLFIKKFQQFQHGGFRKFCAWNYHSHYDMQDTEILHGD